MTPHIAILGWGSLLWDEHPDFDGQHGEWKLDGPELQIEFSRISQSRQGALTLVIDPTNGVGCQVAYTASTRRDADDAICDLRSREGTTRSNIGFYFADGSRSQSKDKGTLATVKTWATAKNIDVVVWTDLPTNFEIQQSRKFSVESALAYLRKLDAKAKAGASEYVWCAPDFVRTPLRTALEAMPRFKQ